MSSDRWHTGRTGRLRRRIAIAVCAVLLCAASARSQCFSRPPDALSLDKTFDAVHLASFCTSSLAPALFANLHLDADDWTDGYGILEIGGEYVIGCDPNAYLSRLLNGAYIVREVERHSVVFGQHRPVAWNTAPFPLLDAFSGFLVDNGFWSTFASGITPEWEPECETDSNATNHVAPPDNYIGLKIPGAYKKSAMYRAAIIAHEPTHEVVGHGDDDSCTNDGSCDDEYGAFNSNTMHVNFLYDAASTYRVELVEGTLARKVIRTGDQCRFIPRFDEAEREEARNKAEKDLGARFAQMPPASLVRYDSVDALDTASGTPFECASCDLAPHTFAPDVCSQSACNETLNPTNAGINASRRAACVAYNTAVEGEFVTPDVIAIAKDVLQDALLPTCLPTNPNAARAYCDAQKAAAATAADVDACGWLDPYYTPAVSKQACVEEYCAAKWAATGGWDISEDPFGCLEYLCAGDACGDTNEAACKTQFVIMQGDPDLYGALCRLDGCQKMLIDCLVALTEQQPPAWAYGQTIPPSCNVPAQVCREAHEIALRLWLEFLPDVLGPLHETLRDPRTSNPAASLIDYAAEFRAAVAAGASFETRDGMARHLTSAPELVAALFNAAPGEFAWLFGRDGFAETLGPYVERVALRPIDRSRLSTAGRQAYDELAAKLAIAPGGQLQGAIGTVAFR
jgi:hypothetical protein